ncbi:MAG: amidohydrolase family protein [Nitrososphaerota archaeon]|nr:amidohydrolase family protein [Nitrososphaerota archaeon]
MEIIDCHVHICPDNLAERNKEIIQRFSGITPAYDGSVGNLFSMMQKNRISKAIVNNTVLKAELMSKANDFTAQTVSKHSELIGMAWIIPGSSESVEEIERCKNLGFKGVKMHNSHFKIMPSDSRNDKIYEKIVEHALPVLFHCGFNPYTASGEKQYAIPRNFLDVIKCYPEMKIILGHLAGYQDDPAGAIKVVSASDNVFADLALDPGKPMDLNQIITEFGSRKLIFGSDYPIHEASEILHKINDLDTDDSASILALNSESVFAIS